MRTNTMKCCWNGSTGTTAVYSMDWIYINPVNSACSNEAVQSCLKKFTTGDAAAMYELARCCLQSSISDDLVRYITGNLVFKTKLNELARNYALGLAEPDSDSEAFQLFKLVEDYNDPDVLCTLARAYRFGWGVGYDIAKAVEYYVKAADFGSFKAMERLRECEYYNVDEQLKIAFYHFKQEAETGNANARFAVAYCYHYGIWTASNSSLARYMCEAAANQQNSSMMVLLGHMYEYGYGVEKNQAKAVELYKQAAAAGNKEGYFQLGWCYYYAIGAAKDYKQTAVWYEKAAAQGHAYAAYKMGKCYENGKGVDKDLTKAFRYFKQAAIAGDMNGQSNTGYCYENREGVKQNYERAVYWYQKAAIQGYLNVVENLEYCLEYLSKTRNGGTDIPKAEPKIKSTQSVNANQRHELAFYLAKFAANSGCNRAYSCLGDCYFSGIGTRIDFTAAVQSYERAEPSNSQKYFNVIKCLETGYINGRNELDLFSALHQVTAALKYEINSVLLQML